MTPYCLRCDTLGHDAHDCRSSPDPLEVLRADFERLCKCSYGFKRSLRGTYVNSVTANRWKWFQLGAIAARHLDP